MDNSTALEHQGKKIEKMMSKLIEDIDKTHIRKMQSRMYNCASRCCDDEFSTMDTVRSCINKCTLPVERAQQYVQGEFERASKRLDRCFEECRDKIQDKVGPNASEGAFNKHKKEYENCAAQCLEKHCELLVNLEKTVNDTLLKGFSS